MSLPRRCVLRCGRDAALAEQRHPQVTGAVEAPSGAASDAIENRTSREPSNIAVARTLHDEPRTLRWWPRWTRRRAADARRDGGPSSGARCTRARGADRLGDVALQVLR